MTKVTPKAIEDFKKNYRAANGAEFSALPKPMQNAVLERFFRAETETTTDTPKEINGRKGLEPTRFGDWESKGIISDF